MDSVPPCALAWGFTPQDPPRSSWFWVRDVDSPDGLFADGDPRTVPVHEAIAVLADLDVRLASPSAIWWGRAVRMALDLMQRGRLVPAVTAAGWDAWQIDPLDPADHAYLDALAAACPPEVFGQAPGSGPLSGSAQVAEPAWLLRAVLDAVADRFVRTAAAPVALGAHPFAGDEPTCVEHVRPWLASAYGHLTSTVRMGLRVDVADGDGTRPVAPPEASTRRSVRGAEGVQCEVLVQVRSTQDPSLVIDADQLDRCSPSVASRLGSDVAAEVIVGLGRAARCWPPLGRALGGDPAGPSEPADGRVRAVRIDVEELDQLVEAAERLTAMGVEVLWPKSFNARLRPRLVAAEPSRAAPGSVQTDRLVGFGVILDFRWEVLCDGVPLEPDELDALADAKRSIVWLRDRWVRTDREVLDRIRSIPDELSGPAGLAAALAGEIVDGSGETVEVVAGDVIERLRGQLDDLGGRREAEEPTGLAATLRPYQRRGLAWMIDLCEAGLGGVLADDMGLGKTVQVIALHLALRERSTDPQRRIPQSGSNTFAAAPTAGGPTLVICPTSVLGNWAREIARFAPGLRVHTLAGSDRSVAGIGRDDADTVVLVTYGVMRRMAEELAEVPWRLVVCDEAQQVKNPRSRTAQALRRIPAGSRLALTGTPVENRLSELWALLDWTTPGLLGSFDGFRRAFVVPIERGGSHEVAQRLATLSRPFMLRRRKTDPGIADDLPPRTHHDVVVSLSPEQLTMYEAMVRASLEEIQGTEGADRVGMVFRLLTGLKQIANHPGQYLHESDGPLDGRSGKLDAAVELVSAATDGGERVLVFSQYVEMCHLIRRRFAEVDLHAEVLHGGLSASARDRLVDRFQSGDLEVLIVSLKAGGTGLNLTAATQVVHFDRWWNPAVEDQATDRAWRMGQTRPVVVHRLISEGTIEERIAEMIERKRHLADQVVGSGESWIAELDDDDLARMVTLRAGGVTFAGGELLGQGAFE